MSSHIFFDYLAFGIIKFGKKITDIKKVDAPATGREATSTRTPTLFSGCFGEKNI